MTELAHVQQAAELFHTSQGATKEAAPALLGPGHKRLLATLNLHWATKYPARWAAPVQAGWWSATPQMAACAWLGMACAVYA